ncbi:unnamed protein product [Tilletia controversa]|uniref:DNA-directed RNA polymerase III subunit RPC9 n=3 Tax=Tilletia TaxID=13289 RepID=A0A8X7SSL2_9BASI|nr:hypothetical protein CF336_g9212 [Tilletia laevis]KAE8180963.1 hypothetical protein CF328_g8990 [Tilletia controversa]KAE8239980.1 hypothetical protein A4X03_0g8627 [Tilletia caries]KAE8181298.1 hypothetical protein CF335_g8981 [Tilletia laevis]KAE8237870.1 hypothetical protein A4X06_0g9075 [Tilletia controversa]
MRVPNARVALICDHEALELARSYSRARKPDSRSSQGAFVPLKSGIDNLNTIHYELMTHLTSLDRPRPCLRQTPAGITAFLTALQTAGFSPSASLGPRREEALADYQLTKSERLMLVNHAPTSQVFLNTLIEECFVRFTPEQIETILALVREHLLPADGQVNGAADHNGNGDDAGGEDVIDEDEYLNA